jgi:hypothetical protein
LPLLCNTSKLLLSSNFLTCPTIFVFWFIHVATFEA